MAKSKWMIATKSTPSGRTYAAYRLKDVEKEDHGPNREYYGRWCSDRQAVSFLVEDLNDREGRDGSEERAERKICDPGRRPGNDRHRDPGDPGEILLGGQS